MKSAVFRRKPPAVVSADEVSICSPFPPHLPEPGRWGVHFVGLNDRWLPWDYNGRPATECVREHRERLKAGVYEKVGFDPSERSVIERKAEVSAV